MNQGMMNMMEGMDQMGKDMQGLMNHINKLMGDSKMMNDSDMKEPMNNMMDNMKAMMKEYKTMLNNMDELQKGKGK
ncbi:MAG: hypothetical protein Q8S01_10400, partial [Ignavibacteria bacterium]|nr:hypothetical protein [Ignavibacteria bacterium]